MKQFKINKNYLLLKNWWETIDLSNYEKSHFNREIISFNSILSKRSILFKVTIIFFPSLIKDLISLNSFLFKSPETINKIRSE